MIKVAKLGDIWVGPRPQGDPRELIGHQGGTKAGWYTNYANNSAYTYGIYGFHDYIMYHDVFISARCLDTQHFCFFLHKTHTKKNACTRTKIYGFRQSKCSVAELWTVHDTEEASCRRAWAR